MKPEAKNSAEMGKLEKQIEEMKAKLSQQDLEKKKLEDKVKAFDSVKAIMPEAEIGEAKAYRESSHAGHVWEPGGVYEAVRTKDTLGKVEFLIKIIRLIKEMNDAGEASEREVEHNYRYSPMQFHRFFNWKPTEGEEISGEEFLKEARKRRSKG